MTREEAKSFIIDISYELGNMAVEYLTEKDGEKMREAIKVLEQEPCEDYISRQAAIDMVRKNAFRLTLAEERGCEGYVVWSAEAVYRDTIKDALLELPPVTPQPKTGHWVEENINEWSRKIFCSECGCAPPFEHISNGDIYSANGYGVSNKTKYCPNCGARMVEPQEGASEE